MIRAAFGLLMGSLLFWAETTHAAAALTVRSYPASLHEYEIDAQHGMTSLLLQNLAIVNTGSEAATIDRVLVSVKLGDAVLQQVAIDADGLAAGATQAARLEQAGVVRGMDFQFNAPALLGDGVGLADTRRLGARQALLVLYRMFTYRGHADSVSVDVSGKDEQGLPVHAAGKLSISNSPARVMRFPLRGTYYVANSPSFHSAHRWAVMEEFAYDIIRVGADGRSYRGKGTRRTDYYAYGDAVLAAKSGRVVAVVNDVKESDDVLRKENESLEDYQRRVLQHQSELLSRGIEAAAGNYVLVEQGESEYALYAHLATGSVRVAVGDTLSEGQAIGKLGTSGNSTEPHLHFQVCDKASFVCASVPLSFSNVRINFADAPRAIQTGDFVTSK